MKDLKLIDLESQYLFEMFLNSQLDHLSNSLFPLESILIEPELLAPPVLYNYDHLPGQDSLVLKTIPYQIDWPEIATSVPIPRIKLLDLPWTNLRLLITGEPGVGKTTALNYLISEFSSPDKDGKVPKNGYIPVSLNVSDIQIDEVTNDPVKVITDILSNQFKKVSSSSFDIIIKHAITANRLILLIDGFDQCYGETYALLIKWLAQLSIAVGENPIILVADSFHLNGLLPLNFWPCVLAPWKKHNKDVFLKKWEDAWRKYIQPLQKEGEYVNYPLVNGWLQTDERYLNPFELTLKTLSSYCNSLSGKNISSLYSSYFFCITHASSIGEELGSVSTELFANQQTHISPMHFERNINRKPMDYLSLAESHFIETDMLFPIINPVSKSQISSFLYDSGCIIPEKPTGLRFRTPALAAYCSQFSISKFEKPENLIFPLTIHNLARGFSASRMNDIPWLAEYVQEMAYPIYSTLNQVGRWLRLAQNGQVWRSTILREMATLLRNKSVPITTKLGFVVAICLSDDNAASVLFTNGIKSTDIVYRQMCILGCGISKDRKALDYLIELLSDSYDSIRISSCVALANYCVRSTNEILTEILLGGEEKIQLASAEVFSSWGDLGFDILLKATTSNDLMVRRAAVKGLTFIREARSTSILEKISIDDSQWIVKNAALQGVESHSSSNPFIPISLPPASKADWLLEATSRLEQKIPSTGLTYSLLILLLEKARPEEIYSTIGYIPLFEEDIIPQELFYLLHSSDETHRLAAFYCIYLILASGKKIPSEVITTLYDVN